MNLISIPALKDNYIWLLIDDHNHCIIIDPGESSPILSIFNECNLIMDAILLTHHHQDHLDGVTILLKNFPKTPIYGPQETEKKGANIIIGNGDNVSISHQNFSVIAIPGHTLGHIAYYNPPYLFCGDTIFSAGCGRLFESTGYIMYRSLQKIMQLPDDTLICSGHEYTLSNLEFALSILSEDKKIAFYQKKVIKLREKKQPSLPTTLKLEREINIFLRCDEIDLQKKVLGVKSLTSPSLVFSTLRRMKDSFES